MNVKMGKRKSGVRKRQSSSDDTRPPMKRRNSEAILDGDDTDCDSNIEEEEEMEGDESVLIGRLVEMIERSGKSNNGGVVSSGNKSPKKKEKNKGNHEDSREPEKRASTSSSSGNALDVTIIIEQTVKKALAGIVPIIKEVINDAVDKRLKRIEEQYKEVRDQVERNRVRSVMEADKAEQYSRRDNIIISGIKEEDNEQVDSMIGKVLEVCAAINAPVKKEDISAIHRLGKRRADKNRAIIVRTTRIAKQEIMRKKKNLKDNQAVVDSSSTEDKVYINEDITEPRRKLQEYIRGSGLVNYCFFREGTIVCKKGDRFIHVNDADDLFKLGLNNLDYNMFYKDLE